MDSSLARALARQSRTTWLAEGNTLDEALKGWCTQAHRAAQQGRPPVKVAQHALTQLAALLASSPLPQTPLQPSGARRHEATVCLPQAAEDTTHFVQATCDISGRVGITLKWQPLLSVSQHAIERLHQRMDVVAAHAVLQELHSGLLLAPTMNQAAHTAGAKHWPLLTTHGLGVCVPAQRSAHNLLLTWMRFDQLGKKWGRVADDLRTAQASNPALLHDPVFCAEVLRLYAWLLRPHSPAADLGALWWAARESGAQEQALQNFEAKLNTSDVAAAPAERASASTTPFDQAKPSSPNGFGLDCEGHDEGDFDPHAGPPTINRVQAHTQHEGIVMQIRSSGARVIALQNGHFGMLPATAFDTEPPQAKAPAPVAAGAQSHAGHPPSHALIAPQAAQLGARLRVEVLRVFDRHDTRPLAVLLQAAEVADANWQHAQAQHPVGAMVQAQVVWRGSHGTVLSLPDGASGWLSDSEMSWLLPHAQEGIAHDCSAKQTLSLRVIGHSAAHKRLVLSLRQVNEPVRQEEAPLSIFPVDSVVEGMVVWLDNGSGVVIKLPRGCSGWLPNKALSWLKEDTDAVRATLRLGQILHMRVTGHHAKQQKFQLSLRAMTPHPILQWDEADCIGSLHQGCVTRVVDYGAFVRLPIGLDGLLHCSDMPAGMQLSAGDAITVRIHTMDKVRLRLSLQAVLPAPSGLANAEASPPSPPSPPDPPVAHSPPPTPCMPPTLALAA